MNYIKTIITIITAILLFSCSTAHSKNTDGELKEMQAADIIKDINKGKDIVIINAIIYGDLKFSDSKKVAVGGPRQALVEVSGNLYFQDCVFMGEVSTEGVITNKENKVTAKKRTSFKGEVNFINCDFRKEVNFNESLFADNLLFSQTTFNEKASFNHILVNGRTCLFNETHANKRFECVIPTIRGELNFMDASFNESVNLSGCSVDNLILNNLQCEGRLELSEATVNGILMFNYGRCEGEANLSFSKFMGRVNINETVFNGEFSAERSFFFGMVKMNRSSFAKKINMKESIFYQKPEMDEIKYSLEDPIILEVKSSSLIEMYH